MTTRHVVLALARRGRDWPTAVARWSTSGQAPLEVLRCLSATEVSSHLASGRLFSALLVDRDAHGFDRDLAELARDRSCATVVIGGDDGDPRADDTLPVDFDVDDLLAALAHRADVPRRDELTTVDAYVSDETAVRQPAALIAVTGTGGAGASTAAAALAQSFCADNGDDVVLADLALHAAQGLIHDIVDVSPTIVELVEAHRFGTPSTDEVRGMSFRVDDRDHRLVLGLRRHHDWSALRPRALAAALDSIRRDCDVLVADVTGDVEGAATSGSTDIEERNTMARTTIGAADVVVVVGTATVTGVPRLIELIRDVLTLGVDGSRVVVVVNQSPARRRDRTALAAAVTDLLNRVPGAGGIAGTVLVPHRVEIELAVRDGRRIPPLLQRLLHPSVNGVLDRHGSLAASHAAAPEPVAVVPGSLASWFDEDDR